MDNNQMSELMRELRHRLLENDIDAEFIAVFFGRHPEIEDSLMSAANESPAYYEDQLLYWVEVAAKDYSHYSELLTPAQERDIAPLRTSQKKRRVRNPKDIAEPSERQDALGHYLARKVSEFVTIISFRKNVLSGRVLSKEEALTFLSSPLAADKSREDKTFRDDPLNQILDTNYQVEEGHDDTGPYRKLLWGSGHTQTLRPLGVVAAHLVFSGDVIEHHYLSGLHVPGGRAVILPHPHEKGRFVVARPGSIIGELVNLANVSLDDLPISREKAVWFILTGEFIPEHPVRIRYVTNQRPYLLSRTTITLEVESWLPPEVVLEQYRHAQHEILGGTPRSLKRKTVDLFEYVNQHNGKTWRELFDAWNEVHPSQRFRDRSHLYTTYKRALDTIASPPTLPQLSLAPTAQRRPR